MKGVQTFPTRPGSDQPHVLANNADEVLPLSDLIEHFLGDQSGVDGTSRLHASHGQDDKRRSP